MTDELLQTSSCRSSRILRAFSENDGAWTTTPPARGDDLVECKDGRIFERHSEPQRAWGRNIGRVWGFREITERRRAEKALQESEERYRLLFERNLAGVYRSEICRTNPGL